LSTYVDALREAMSLCAAQPRSIITGQAVACAGTAMRGTLDHIPLDKLLEFPVAEEMQMGHAIGVSLAGGLPITCYPRQNFLLLAINQLCNHLDKIPLYSDYRPRVIIRTAVAHDKPMDPGAQHLGDYSLALRSMCSTVHVECLMGAEQIVPAYQRAIDRKGSSLLIEYARLY